MKTKRCITLRQKLLAGFAAVALLIVALLLLAHHFISESTRRMEASFVAEIQPLARLNRLQSRINRMRVLEIELPRLSDYFAVTTQLELLKSEANAFSTELNYFTRTSSPSDDLSNLQAAWQHYQADLASVAEQAAVMEMKRVEIISTFESAVRFKTIARDLQDFSEHTEKSAGAARDDALAHLEWQRRAILFTSAAGLLLIAAGLLWFAHSLARRVAMLRDATQRISEGEAGVEIDTSGQDELSDLAQAFNTMRRRVADRESELRVAQAEQELRIEERTRELQASNRQLRLLSLAVEQSPVSIMITDLDGTVEYANKAFTRASGFPLAGLLGKTPRQMREGGYFSPEQFRNLWNAIRTGQESSGEIISRRHNGDVFWEQERISPVSDHAGRITHFVLIREDITLRKQQQEKILFQAQYDHLTQLPNRMLAMDRLSQAIANAQRSGLRVALMFIDLDDFKKVNDSLGHEAGDALLIEAAQRLREVMRAADTIARQGGDEFLAIMGELRDPHDAEIVAAKLIGAFAHPFKLGRNLAVVTPSIGLAIYPNDGETPGTLLRHADLAMYDAKEAGRNTWRYFNRVIHERSAQRLALEQDLRHALSQNEFQLHFQPLVTARRPRLAGAEALLRWESPVHGRVSPDRFIALAEQTGLIVDIGRWVLTTACAQAACWRSAGHGDFRMAVNVSPRQFRESGFIDEVRAALAASGLPAGNLQIEVTEGVLIRNTAEVGEILHELDRMGVRLSMDDFGTGYSSLSYLKRFPFHSLKIDREFIRDLVSDRDDRALVSATIHMGRELGLNVVAEGVENAEQLEFLANQGCDIIQGFYFSQALPAEEFSRDWLNAPPVGDAEANGQRA